MWLVELLANTKHEILDSFYFSFGKNRKIIQNKHKYPPEERRCQYQQQQQRKYLE